MTLVGVPPWLPVRSGESERPIIERPASLTDAVLLNAS